MYFLLDPFGFAWIILGLALDEKYLFVIFRGCFFGLVVCIDVFYLLIGVLLVDFVFDLYL